MKKALAIESVFLEHNIYERLLLAFEAGFAAVEIGGWVDLDLTRAQALRRELGIEMSCLDGSGGFVLGDANHGDHLLEHLSQSIAVAKHFDCRNLVVRCAAAGPEALSLLRAAAARAERSGRVLLLDSQAAGSDPGALRAVRDLILKASSSRLKLFCRVRSAADLRVAFEECPDCVGYVRVECAPGGPSSAELRRALDAGRGYAGFVAFARGEGVSDDECLEEALAL